MIFAIAGSIGSGKNTAAEYLSNFYDFRHESFAASVKDAISVIFGWDRQLLEGYTKESREWREQKDEWWSKRLSMHITPRIVMQTWGTELGRNTFHQDIWVASLENKIRNYKDNIVISDCRFLNEFNMIQKSGGKIIKVNKGLDPIWKQHAIDAFNGSDFDKEILMNTYGIHESDWTLYGLKFDYEIDNNGSIQELYSKIDTIVNKNSFMINTIIPDIVSEESWSKLF